MTAIKAILIDDEQSALKGLEKKIQKLFPKIEILGAFQKPEEGLKALKEGLCNLLFLDIEMPRMNGFELLSSLEKIDFQVIFVTAYSEYALDAIKKAAVDYVLKPTDDDDLIIAINKAVGIINELEKNDHNAKLVKILSDNLNTTNKVIVPTSQGISFIPCNEVKHLEGYDGYTKIHLTDNTMITSSYNLGKFEKKLGDSFFKCHKSHIVNLQQVRGIENEGYLVLNDTYRVPISRSNKKVFLDLFNP